MNLNYGELLIDSGNIIKLSGFMDFKVDKLDLIMFDDYVAIFYPFESDNYIEMVSNDTSISFKERCNKLRIFSKNCVCVDINVSKKGDKNINLAAKIISKYGLGEKLVYEIADGGRIRLWHPVKFEEYRNKIENNTVKAK